MADPDSISPYTALLYIFNLIVGTGTLTLPKAFHEAGWLFGTCLLIFISFVSYITATFVLESMAICNAVRQWVILTKLERVRRYLRQTVTAVENSDDEQGDGEDNEEDSLMLPAAYIDNFPSEPDKLFTLDVKCELSEMVASVYSYSSMGIFVVFFYFVLCVYLFGDLTIYSAAIGKTLVDLSCTMKENVTDTDLCWLTYNFSRRDVYKLYLGVFVVLFGPFVCFNVSKTKYLQFVTAITRWFAFSLMIGLAIYRLFDSSVEHGSPRLAVPGGLPALLGSSVYSFMCHHSLPGLIVPVSDKSRLYSYLAVDYLFITLLYLSLTLTAVFAFPSLQDLYSLNFLSPDGSAFARTVGIFLSSFPLLTLTTSFPIIAVTLRSNLQGILDRFCDLWVLREVCIPILTVSLPVLIAATTENIEALVEVTGSYAGVAIQYSIPAALIIGSRRSIPEELNTTLFNYKSPFQSPIWPQLVAFWSLVSFVLVTVDLYYTR